MKFVNDASNAQEDDVRTVEHFDKTGSVTLSKKEKSFSKVVTMTAKSETSHTYYVKIHDGLLYDPWGMHSHRENYLRMSYTGVSKETFDYYMMYLKTRNALYMTRSQRSFIND